MRPSEFAQVVEFSIQNNWPFLVTGPPGIGKTDIIKQVTERIGTKLLISHPVVSDPTDYKGLPFPDGDSAKFLPFGDLKKLIEAKEPLLFFLDDLGQAPVSVQAASMQLILGRQINGHKVSDHVIFAAATNRKEDRAGVTGILEPVKSRFKYIIALETHLEDWIKWAILNGQPSSLISYLRFKPDSLHDFKPTNDMTNGPCPRTIANVGDIVNKRGDNKIDSVARELYSGAVGEAFATEYIAFQKIERSLPSVDLILKTPDQVPKISSQEPGVMYALCGAIASKVKPKTVENAMIYLDSFPKEFQVVAVKDMISYNEKIVESAPLVKWISKNASDLLI